MAYDAWLFTDGPFIGELCLVFLQISGEKYRARIDELQKMPNAKRRREIEKRLSIHSCSHHRAIEALRLLANAYKHDPQKQPTVELLKHLDLNRTLTYAELPQAASCKRASPGS